MPAEVGKAQKIVGYEQDEQSFWVARLACGHQQHLRHRPPWELRPWVLTEEGRQAHLGTELICLNCAMPTWPAGLEFVRSTKVFDEQTTPKPLQAEHRTKADTWGRIVVEEGRLQYIILTAEPSTFVLKPGLVGIIEPAQAHLVRLQGRVRFRVEFWRPTAH